MPGRRPLIGPEGDFDGRPGAGRTGAAGPVSRRFVAVVTLAFLSACTVPYVVAWSRTPEGHSFSGVLVNPYDQHYYLAAQRSRAEGLAGLNRFTTETEAGTPMTLLYPLAGELQRATRLPALAAYHLPRVLAAAAFPGLVAWFLGLCFPGRREVVGWGVVLTLFVTGVVALVPWMPGALLSSEWVVESIPLRSFTVFPHFAVAYVGLVAAYGSVAMAIRRRPPAAVAGVAAAGGLLVGVSHPFQMLPVAVVTGAAGVLLFVARGRRDAMAVRAAGLIAMAAAVTASLPSVLVVRHHQALFEAADGAPFGAYDPGPVAGWLYGFGVVSILALVGVFAVLSGPARSRGSVLLLAVATVHAALLYLPLVRFQRRYCEGLALGLGGLASVGLGYLGTRAARRLGRERPLHWLAVGTIVVAGAAVTVHNLAGEGEYLADDVTDLSALVTRTDVVLSGNYVGSRLPSRSDGRVYVARSLETIRYPAKRAERSAYAEHPVAPASLAFLRRAGITLVVVDAADPTFAPAPLDPPGACLRQVFQRSSLRAYRVSAPCIEERLGFVPAA